MACGPKEYRVHAEFCLRRARNVRNPILAKEFEKARPIVAALSEGCGTRRYGRPTAVQEAGRVPCLDPLIGTSFFKCS